jgi:hypothetical protein
MLPAALLAASLCAALPIRVEAESCPSGDEIERRLGAMLSPVPESAPPNVARIRRQGEGLHVELVGPDAAVIAERQLDSAGACADLAQMVAVVLASWESDVHPEFARPPADLVPARLLETRSGRDDRQARASRYALAAGLGTSVADTAALSGVLAASWYPGGGRLGMRGLALAETDHTLDLGLHQARWHRWVGGLALEWRLDGSMTSLDAHAGVAVALLQASGADFPENHSAASLAMAPVLGSRGSLWLTSYLGLYLEVDGFYWGRSQILQSSSGLERELSHFQIQGGVGLVVRDSTRPR